MRSYLQDGDEMIFKSEKKGKTPIFTIAAISLAVYGAYSMVTSVKECCCKKRKMITNMFKKKEKCEKCESDPTDEAYD